MRKWNLKILKLLNTTNIHKVIAMKIYYKEKTMNKNKGLIKNSTDRESKHTKGKGANNDRG